MGVAGDGSGTDLGLGDTCWVWTGYLEFAFWYNPNSVHLPGMSSIILPGSAVSRSTRWSWMLQWSRSCDGAVGADQIQSYCTSPRDNPPATNRASNRSLPSSFGCVQAANNTAGAGNGHRHRRCCDPRAERSCNRQKGPGQNHDNDKNQLPTKHVRFCFPFLPNPRNFESRDLFVWF